MNPEERKDEEKVMEDGDQKTTKKTHTSPRLTIHGDVEKLTQALGTGSKDGITGSVLP